MCNYEPDNVVLEQDLQQRGPGETVSEELLNDSESSQKDIQEQHAP